MHSFGQPVWQFLSAVALTAMMANAQQPVTKSYCTTSFDTKSTNPVKTKTDYSTRTEKPTILVTSTPSTTSTPPPSTETSVVYTMTTTTVTADQLTDTFTDTATILTTTTVEAPTYTETSTVYETTETTVTSTSTVPTPAGFIPIQTSVGRSRPAQNVLAKRDVGRSFSNSGSLIARANELRDEKNSGSGAKPRAKYPKKVECKVQVTNYAPAKTSVKTAKTTRTIVAPAMTNTVTEISTLEATSTFLPTPASVTVSTETTVTMSETITPSTTTTTTSTVTNTVNAPTETYYAQCQADNFIGTNGWIGQGTAFESRVSEINSQFECCVACAQQVGCEYAAYQGGANGFGCILLQNSQQTCTDTDQFALLQDINRYVASNGCVNAKFGGP